MAFRLTKVSADNNSLMISTQNTTSGSNAASFSKLRFDTTVWPTSAARPSRTGYVAGGIRNARTPSASSYS